MVSGDRREIQNSRDTFGRFLEKKRKEKEISMRCLAMKLGISATYLFEVEKGRKPPLSLERILLASRILLLNKEEETWLLDLAGRAKKSAVAPDLPAYINANAIVREALRTARDLGADEADWQRFTNRLRKNGGRYIKNTRNKRKRHD